MFWAFDAGGNIYGLRVETLAPTEEVDSRYLDHETKADLRLPVGGEGTVAWGGRSFGQNFHATYRTMRFGIDLTIARNGSTQSGDGARNSDYYCLGQPVLAPGDGEPVERGEPVRRQVVVPMEDD